MLLVVATFAAIAAIKDYFALDWHIESQGINVADAASGAGGDVTISRGNQTIMAAEVTERPVDLNRVVTTFQTKIAPNGIEDYLFFVRPNAPTSDAETQARQHFAQGHEVNFLVISDWIFMVLATIGTQGRAMFVRTLLGLFDSSDVPATLKVAWNEQVQRITATGS